MTTRENQIERVVEMLRREVPADSMNWERHYDLEIYPIENDLNEFETDRLIQSYLKETPAKG